MQSFVKCLFRNTSTNFYRNRFIFDRHRAKYKLAHKLLRHGVESGHLKIMSNAPIHVQNI